MDGRSRGAHLCGSRRVTEVELKLEIDPADAERLLALDPFRDARTKDLVSVYFDTPAGDLRAAGYALRVRHDGDRRVQTVKAVGPAAAGLFVRPEWEREIAGDTPVLGVEDGPVAELAAAGEGRIAPAFRAEVHRAVALHNADAAVVELALDRGEVTADGMTSGISEIELELREGDPRALFALARLFGEVAPVRLGVLTKSDRGYRLADGSAAKPAKAQPIALTPDMNAADGFRVIAAACIRQFRLNEALLAGRADAGALHQARVGLRRLRSALSLFRPMLGDATFDRLKAELRWLAGELGVARNIDVLAERFAGEPIAARIEEGRSAAYANVAEVLAAPRSRLLMLDLAEWLAVGEWLTSPADADLPRQPLPERAVEILDRQRRRVKRRGRGLVDLDDAARHEVRIEAKKLRYAAEFFAPLYPKRKARRRARIFLDALEALQEQLGELNDIATLPSVLADLGLADDPRARPHAHGGRRAKALARADEAYEALVDAKPFWR